MASVANCSASVCALSVFHALWYCASNCATILMALSSAHTGKPAMTSVDTSTSVAFKTVPFIFDAFIHRSCSRSDRSASRVCLWNMPTAAAQAALIEINGWRIVRRPNSSGNFGSPNGHKSELHRPTDATPCLAGRRRHPGCFAFPLTAQEIGDVAAGKRLAETWCSSCHVVAPSAQTGASTGVPTFAAVARMPSTTPISLRAFLQTPHARMPDLHLNRDETDNLIAYILTLRGH